MNSSGMIPLNKLTIETVDNALIDLFLVIQFVGVVYFMLITFLDSFDEKKMQTRLELGLRRLEEGQY